MINERYNELLQSIARLMAAKNVEMDKLHDEIKTLKDKLREAEQSTRTTQERN